MGSISTLAAGALNTVTMDLTEAAAASSFDVASGSVAAAGSTVSASAYDRGVTPGRRIAPCGGVRMEVLAGSDTRHDTTPAHPPRGKRTWTWHHVAANASPTDGSLAPVRDPQAATRAIGNAVITEGV